MHFIHCNYIYQVVFVNNFYGTVKNTLQKMDDYSIGCIEYWLKTASKHRNEIGETLVVY